MVPLRSALVVAMLSASCCALGPAPEGTPNPIYDSGSFSTKLQSVPNGVLYSVAAPDNASMLVMHVYGSPTERGFAHGQLLSAAIADFATNELDAYFKSQVDSLDLTKLPPWLAKEVHSLLHHNAPAAFRLLLDWVYGQQKGYVAASKAKVLDEMAGMVGGICSPAGNGTAPAMCSNVKKMTELMHQVNMLPELVQMQCSMMGAWGPATPDGKLTQLRTLDFGGGPFADRTLLIVHHPTDSPHSFASLSFPGFVGVVTGFSETMSLSEKVDDVSGAGGKRPKGTYKGQAVSMVIRDMVQFADTKEAAVETAQAAHRTWSVWLGVGDYASQEFVAMLYDEEAAVPYNDTTLPALTHQPAFPGVAYIDKHAQPSAAPDMPALVKEYYGNLTSTQVAQYIPRRMRSGDVHIAVYDFGKKEVLIATGTTDGPTGNYTRLACDAPFLRFDMTKLWSEPKP